MKFIILAILAAILMAFLRFPAATVILFALVIGLLREI
jgi:hypothetical protein